MKELLFGAAYYDEYMPYDRLQQDVAMMKKAGINTVRIAESTWSTCEPQEGVFDFSHVERVMDAMEEAGINVIIGTPTYAIPTWMVKSHPDVMAETVNGRGIYGARQIMDITHPVYRFYAERVIRKLMECTAYRKCVIGFQVDNETKYYGTAGKNVQEKFVKYLRRKFNNDLDAMNHEFGLDYWSNRINAWEDFPDVRGTINGSLGAEFEKFQRTLVDEFLSWQADIVNEYRREDQFITHNFDFEWRGYSYGVQTVFFLPCVICGVAVGLTWTFVYNGNYGLLNGFLKAIGLGGLQQMWLANKETAMLCIIIVIMWQYVGYHMVIQLAAMRNIDSSFYEAAEIDGATGWQQFKYITFPLIKPILKIDAVLIITGSLKYYDLVAVMTSGGPNHATEVMSTYMYYQSFNILNYGYASAIGVVLMLLCILSVGISNRVFKTDETV